MPPMSRTARVPARLVVLVMALLAVASAACSPREPAIGPSTTSDASPPSSTNGDTGATETPLTTDATAVTPEPAAGAEGTRPEAPTPSIDSAATCGADALHAAIERGPEQGTLSGMAQAPAGIAVSAIPVLTRFVNAIHIADLGDTLNRAGSLTILAPTDCAFAQTDPTTLDAVLADPQGQLT
ncbi:MAG TPA: fasciclin domain-containing protein, partial [Euzebya sp.]|nr:fasciclin domain-containing protein [Euzebya sp.]